MLSLFPRDVLDEICDLIWSFSEGFLSTFPNFDIQIRMNLAFWTRNTDCRYAQSEFLSK